MKHSDKVRRKKYLARQRQLEAVQNAYDLRDGVRGGKPEMMEVGKIYSKGLVVLRRRNGVLSEIKRVKVKTKRLSGKIRAQLFKRQYFQHWNPKTVSEQLAWEAEHPQT